MAGRRILTVGYLFVFEVVASIRGAACQFGRHNTFKARQYICDGLVMPYEGGILIGERQHISDGDIMLSEGAGDVFLEKIF